VGKTDLKTLLKEYVKSTAWVRKIEVVKGKKIKKRSCGAINEGRILAHPGTPLRAQGDGANLVGGLWGRIGSRE